MKTFFEWLVLHESLKDYFGRLGNNWQEVDKLAAEAIKGWMDWSGGDGDGYRDYARQELSSPSDEDDIPNEEIETHALKIAKEEMYDRIYDMIYKFGRFHDPLHLYREINVEATQLPKVLKNIRLIRLGQYWSWDERAAQPHWGGAGKTIAMYAQIPGHCVNWKSTLIKNSVPSYQDEKEIEVIEGSPVTVQAIRIDGSPWKKVNLSGFV